MAIRQNRNKHNMHGFTLLEMSIVLILIGVIVGGSITIFTASLQKHQLDETLAKLQTIQATLYNYRVAFNRLPCPADITLALTDPNFGVEAAYPGYNASPAPLTSPGDCVEGTPRAYWNGGTASDGGVPTQTLRLPDDYGMDGWGRRIKYVVDTNFTAPGAFTTNPYPDTTAPGGARLNVFNTRDVAGGGVHRTQLTNLAAYVLISFGPDGNGAFPRTGGTTSIGANTVNYDELTNCTCALDGTNSGQRVGMNPVYIQKAPTMNPANRFDNFGDVVVYGTRATLALPSEQ